MDILTQPENKSPTLSADNKITALKTRPVNGIISTGSPDCQFNKCSNRSVPGHLHCGPHGGKLTLRLDGTLGIIGPGTYRAIAQLAGLNHRYVSQVLQGKSNPTSSVLERIAQVVGVEIGWLVDYIKGQKQI